jgi:hypothetical protein
MTTSTLTVTEFVLARIAGDESFALSAQAAASIYDEGTVRWHWLRTDGTSRAWEPTLTDPARVLAQCAAMRKIVEMFQTARPAMGEWESDYASAAYDAVRALASIWSDHPEFDPAWA